MSGPTRVNSGHAEPMDLTTGDPGPSASSAAVAHAVPPPGPLPNLDDGDGASGAVATATATTATGPRDGEGITPYVPPVRRRNRPALSCIQCRTRKVRCDRNEPCNSCLKSKIVNCTFEEARRPKPKFWKLPSGNPATPSPVGGPALNHVDYAELPPVGERNGSRQSTSPGARYASSAAAATSASASWTPANNLPVPETSSALRGSAGPSAVSGSDAGSLAMRVRELEDKLAEAMKTQETSHLSTPTNNVVLSKTRYFGAGHWMSRIKLFPYIMSLAARIEGDKNSEAAQILERCKRLGRLIKARRTPATPAVEIGIAPVPEALALRLVEAYLRTFETVYRIVHIPTFWADYKRYWANPSGVDRAFVVQLQLCMAIGTCFQDDVVALRHLSTQWIYEAQTWLGVPFEKSRLTLSGLQVMCLLHLAREACGVGGDLTWISMGATLRAAMFMGLHRDPEHLSPMSLYAAEMRRRLWATMLEMILQSSFGAGGPALITPNDFDTKPPSNFDDDQLIDTGRFSAGPRPPGTFTQSSVQIALLKSFACRLSVAAYVNGIHITPTYDETLRRNSELTVACRTLSATLQSAYDPAGVIPNRISLFQLQLTEHMMHRFFLGLNASWLLIAVKNPAYYFARKLCIDAALKIYRSAAQGSKMGDGSSTGHTSDFARLCVSGSGAFRAVLLQSVSMLAQELLSQVLEDRNFRQTMGMDQPGMAGSGATADHQDAGNATGSLGCGVAPRTELVEALTFATAWTESRIRHGETNIKGFVFGAALEAQIDAVQRGLGDAETERFVLSRLRDACMRSLRILQDLAGGTGGATATSEGEDALSLADSSGADSFGYVDQAGFGLGVTNEWGWVWDELNFPLNPGGLEASDLTFDMM